MRSFAIRLHSVALPLVLLPLMDFRLSQIPGYFKGLEFRAFVAELMAQVASGIVDAGIIAVISGLFSAVGG